MPKSDLLSLFLSSANFQSAWDKVASNQGCAGVDGETISLFAAYTDQKLETLRRTVKAGTYKPLPLRQFLIPKKKEGWRSLAVPTVRDRIVQQALLNILHPIFEPQFEDSSFAYRPGRSHLMAVRQIDHWHQRGYDWLLDADLVDFFGNVAHPRLLAEVSERLQTKALQQADRNKSNSMRAQAGFSKMVSDLVSGWIGSGILTAEGLILPGKGVPQGSVISPLLSNVYLDDFDEQIAKTPFKLVRYADDFLLMGRSEKQLQEAMDLTSELLTDMGLQLHQQKTELTNFKRGFRFLGHSFVGDLILKNQVNLKKTTEAKSGLPVTERMIHVDEASKPTAIQQALFEALKASQKPIPPPLFVVLGFKVRESQPLKINNQELPWRSDMSTLYLVQQETTLRKEQGRFLVKTQTEDEEPKTIEIPIQEVERVLVFGNIQFTTSAISSCLESKIPVIFLTQRGEYKGHLWSAEYCDLPAEAAQFKHSEDEAFRLAVARQIVLGKLANSRHLLLRLNRSRKLTEIADAIERLQTEQETIKDPSQVQRIDQLMGHEGVASRYYFEALGALIDIEEFEFKERNRRPPKDPVNSLLSFGYTLLFNNVLSLLLAEGINPYLGNLHGSERKEAFLAFDLMEEFRSPIVDTLVLTLINQKVLRPTDFTWPDANGGVYLLEPGRRVFLKQFEGRISKAIKHPDSNTDVSYRRIIQLQIQCYKRTLLMGVTYEPFKRVG